VRLTVVGLGYVGLVTAACMAEWGNDVIGIDASEHRLSTLLAGRIPIFEPGLEQLVQSNRERGRLKFRGSADLARSVQHSDVVMVAVGTHDGNGGWQTETISSTLEQLVPLVGSATVLVIRSTLPPDYIARLSSSMSQRSADGAAIATLLNPEFTREGTAVRDFMKPDRVLLGIVSDDAGVGRRMLTDLYEAAGAPIVVLPAIDAAVGKLAANLFLATKISFANELAAICDGYGSNVDNVVSSMSYDPRIGGGFLRPGVGFGGSCLPHQLSMALLDSQERKVHTPLLAAVKQINEFQPARVMEGLADLLPQLADARVALLGLTFKPDTDDCRESPALKLARLLLAAGAAVIAYDPMESAGSAAQLQLPGIELASSAMDALSGADATVLATEWALFQGIDWMDAARVARHAIIVDGRNVLDGADLVASGWVYHAFGRGTTYPAGWVKPLGLEADGPVAVPVAAPVEQAQSVVASS
jgi:UDPglucose 6-dehydrogenase